MRAVPGKFLGIVAQDPVALNPTGYMLTSSGFDAFIHLRCILQIPLK